MRRPDSATTRLQPLSVDAPTGGRRGLAALLAASAAAVVLAAVASPAAADTFDLLGSIEGQGVTLVFERFSAQPLARGGTFRNAVGELSWSAAAGPGVIRGAVRGRFDNPGGQTIAFGPRVNAGLNRNTLTVAGPAGPAIATSINLHVDATLKQVCGSTFRTCSNRFGFNMQGTDLAFRQFLFVSGPSGTIHDDFGGLTVERLLFDPFCPGFGQGECVRIHGDFRIARTVRPNEPFDYNIGLELGSGNAGGFGAESSLFDLSAEVSLAPTGRVLNDLPAGYTVNGSGVVDNRWRDPFAPARVIDGDLVVTDCDDPLLANVVEITGDLVIENVADCDAISLPNLERIGGDVNVSGNTSATGISLDSLSSAGGSVNVSGNTSATGISLDSLTDTGGSVNVNENTSATGVTLDSLTSAGGSVNVNENTSATGIDLGSLTDTGGAVNVNDNTSATGIDLRSLTGTGGDLSVTDNGPVTEVTLGSRISVAGNLALDSSGEGLLDLAGVDVVGTTSLTVVGYSSVAGTTAAGSTTVELGHGEALVRAEIPGGAFVTRVPFTLTRLDPAALPPEDGTAVGGTAAAVDPVAAYAFNFGVPALDRDATLTFEVRLDGLDAATRIAFLAALDAGTATLATKGELAGDTYQAFALCAGAEVPTADGCVLVEKLDADGQPTTGPPATVRFSNVIGHFSTWAVVIVQDSTPPVITPTVSGTLGNDAWHTSDVSVFWTVEDRESEIRGQTGCGTQTVSSDTAGVTFTCEATSAGGTSSEAVTVKRDATPPEITGSRAPEANVNGWNNSDVTVTFTCSDALSGIHSCSPATTIAGEGAGQSAAGSAIDKAGNSATATVTGVSIDKTPPTIAADVSPAANVRGWHRTPVSVSFACADALSGLAACPPAQTLTEPGVQTVSASALDRADNATALSLVVQVAGVVAIDVKPGGEPNSVGCKAENAEIPVAILSSAGFDATTVDADSVRFGKTGGEAAETHRDRDGEAKRHLEDANRDGRLDLVLHFRLRDTGFSCADIPAGARDAVVSGHLTGFADAIGIDGDDALRLTGA